MIRLWGCSSWARNNGSEALMYSRDLNRESGYDSTFRNDRLLKESGGVLKFQNMVLSVVREHTEGLNCLDTIELPNPKVKSEDIIMYERTVI